MRGSNKVDHVEGFGHVMVLFVAECEFLRHFKRLYLCSDTIAILSEIKLPCAVGILLVRHHFFNWYLQMFPSISIEVITFLDGGGITDAKEG